jgi:hypothetical protein
MTPPDRHQRAVHNDGDGTVQIAVAFAEPTTSCSAADR